MAWVREQEGAEGEGAGEINAVAVDAGVGVGDGEIANEGAAKPADGAAADKEEGPEHPWRETPGETRWQQRTRWNHGRDHRR